MHLIAFSDREASHCRRLYQRAQHKSHKIKEKGDRYNTIMNYMKKTVAKELGVKCIYCHNLKDYASDEKEKKVAAREMMRMVMHINKNTMKPMELHEVSCWVCHRGQKHPEHLK